MSAIPHFYQKIQGWFDFQELYKMQVDKSENGAHFVEIGCQKLRLKDLLQDTIILGPVFLMQLNVQFLN